MSAETLRQAAALMRERATASQAGGWGRRGWFGPDARETILFTSPAFRPQDAEHIASWHPAVALAVAEWLDHEARGADVGELPPLREKNALAVARAYLGEDS